jgi:hypothetical protein
MSISSGGYNVVGALTGCSVVGDTATHVTGDPALGALAANGGPTQTHALMTGSSAIDQGDPAGCDAPTGAALATDQRGLPRPVGARCDIGAYEVQ